LAPNATTFVALQFLARGFAIAETLIAVVVISEEFPPEHRGWGIGALGAIQACGAGLAALAFGFVDVLPHGWRDLYLVGLVPLAFVAYWRRTLPETERFAALERERKEERERAEANGLRSAPALTPVLLLLREQPLRFWGLLFAAVAIGAAMAPASFFAPKYLQDVHGWAPAAVAALTFGGGAFGIIGNPAAGWLGDRHGRRPIATAFGLCFVLAAMGFYGLVGIFAPALWILLIFGMMGSQVTLAAFGAELFPTAQRSTASGLRGGASEVGAMVGLAMVSALFVSLGSNWLAVMGLAAVVLLFPLVVWLAFPETARRTLEEITPEPSGAQAERT
jgi:putative MFS transporter